MLTFEDKGEPIAKAGKKILHVSPLSSSGHVQANIINLKNATFEPVPNYTRENIYIAGPSGSGKSYWTSMYAKNFKKMFKKKKVFVFSRLECDKTLDDIGVIRVPLGEDLVNDPIDIQTECEDGSLIIFDDCDTIQDGPIKDAVTKIMLDILETGRHKNIYCIITSHLLNKTKRNESYTIFNEAHRIVIFPRSGNKVIMERIISSHVGLEPKRVKNILQTIKSRWVCFGKNYPMYMLWETGAQML